MLPSYTSANVAAVSPSKTHALFSYFAPRVEFRRMESVCTRGFPGVASSLAGVSGLDDPLEFLSCFNTVVYTVPAIQHLQQSLGSSCANVGRAFIRGSRTQPTRFTCFSPVKKLEPRPQIPPSFSNEDWARLGKAGHYHNFGDKLW